MRTLLPSTVQHDTKNVRNILKALGLGDWQATAVIPYAFMSPAVTDPQMPSVVVLVKGLQNRLGVPVTGVLDDATQVALDRVGGSEWESRSWAELAKAAIHAHAIVPRYRAPAGIRVIPQSFKFEEVLDSGPLTTRGAQPSGLGGPLDFLPDVPGGVLTYAVAGYLIWRALKKGA